MEKKKPHNWHDNHTTYYPATTKVELDAAGNIVFIPSNNDEPQLTRKDHNEYQRIMDKAACPCAEMRCVKCGRIHKKEV